MKIRQAKLAQALRGETSNIISHDKYELVFDKGMLHAKLKHNPKSIGPFIVFPANIAFIECFEEVETAPLQEPVAAVKSEKKAKK
jgi:hypothetical protein